MMRDAIESAEGVAVGPYSHAVRSNGQLYCSGQTPIDSATGSLVEGGIGVQTAQCIRNLLAVVDAAGLSEADVVQVKVYLVDMDDFAQMNEVYSSLFTSPYPARTTIGVAALPLGAAVEIELIAWASA